MTNPNTINPALNAGALAAATAGDWLTLARPGLQPALMQTFGMLAAGHSATTAVGMGVTTFVQTPAGLALGQQASQAVRPMLDAAVKQPFLAANWGKLTEVAAKPGHLSGLVTGKLGSSLGPKAGPALGKFTEELLHIATTKGFGEAIKFGSKAAPGLLKLLGKFAKFLPGAGLALALVSGLKTLADPRATAAQKLTAIMGIGAGAVGLVPGVGTAAQLAVTGATTVASVAADSSAKKKGWA